MLQLRYPHYLLHDIVELLYMPTIRASFVRRVADCEATELTNDEENADKRCQNIHVCYPFVVS